MELPGAMEGRTLDKNKMSPMIDILRNREEDASVNTSAKTSGSTMTYMWMLHANRAALRVH